MTLDILLDGEGDIALGPDNSFALTRSAAQAARTRLRWARGEWRLGPSIGFPWLEEALVKNPDLPRLKRLIAEELRDVDGAEVRAVEARLCAGAREAAFGIELAAGGEAVREEAPYFG